MQSFKIAILTFSFLLIIGFIGCALFITSGLFNVSASTNEGALLNWVLTTIRNRSIATHSANISVPNNLNDPAIVMEGFKHYREMCVACHRAPGLAPSEISQGLNPTPPNFSRMKEFDKSPAEIFWVVKNGIRMTGMPAWGITHNDEKIWAIVGFVMKLPGMTPIEYQTMNEKTGHQTESHMH